MNNYMNLKDWNIEQMTGYKPKTTFYTDFSIAERFGEKGIRDTFKRAFEEWKNDVEYLTELVMVLNWKIWEHYEFNEEFANIYNELWRFADGYAIDNLNGDELAYFYNTTD